MFKKFFVCSDELKHEIKLKRLFPKNVIINHKGKAYVGQKDGRKWRSKESIEMALVDLYILASTDLKYYNAESTFAQTALILGGRG